MKEYPLITFAIICYNQEQFIQEAILGALSQTYPNLEILVTDDHSTDNTFNIANEILRTYKGKHTISINQNKENIGLISHINKVFEISSGRFIIAAAGDDISLPNRAEEIYQKFQETGALLVHSAALEIDRFGTLSGRTLPLKPPFHSSPLIKAAWSQSIYLGATGAWSKELFEIFGKIKYKNSYEDQVLGFRATTKNRIQFIDKPLIKYRSNIGLSNTKRLSKQSLTNCTALQKQKILDLVSSNTGHFAMLPIASIKLALCIFMRIIFNKKHA